MCGPSGGCSNTPLPALALTFLSNAKEQELPAGLVLRDGDSKCVPWFDQAPAAGGATAKTVGFRSPNQNAYVQAVEGVCLDRFVAFGTEHLDLLCREYAEHYHAERPHQVRRTGP